MGEFQNGRRWSEMKRREKRKKEKAEMLKLRLAEVRKESRELDSEFKEKVERVESITFNSLCA